MPKRWYKTLFELNGKLYCDPSEELQDEDEELKSGLKKICGSRRRIFCLSGINAKCMSKCNLTMLENLRIADVLKPWGGPIYEYIADMVRVILTTKSQRGVALGLPVGAMKHAGVSDDAIQWLRSIGCYWIHDITDRQCLSNSHECSRLDICRSEIVSCLDTILTEDEKTVILGV